MTLLEINHQLAVLPEGIPELLTTERAVAQAFGPDHYLMDSDTAQQLAGDDEDRRMTIPELRQAIDWDDTLETLQYPLIGDEARVVITALRRHSRQPASWDQANAALMLESMGMTGQASMNRLISAARTLAKKTISQLA